MAHIPTVDIRQLGDISFDRQLALAQQPNRDYNVDRWLFVPNTYTEYRYILGTRGKKPLICVGINPSTARPGALDPTLKSVERIARNSGFDSFIMFNVYAQRATSPDDMERTCNPELHRENMRAFAYILSRTPDPVVWAAWGTIIEKRDYLWPCLRDMIALGEAAGARWVTCGKRSAAGHPHHPLYLRADAVPEPFDVAAYAAEDRCAERLPAGEEHAQSQKGQMVAHAGICVQRRPDRRSGDGQQRQGRDQDQIRQAHRAADLPPDLPPVVQRRALGELGRQH